MIKESQNNQKYLILISRFKNERHLLYEWVHHHFAEGVDKILLIDDNSDDNYLENNSWLKVYIENRKLEICDASTVYQQEDYDFHIEKIKEYTWVVQIDLDEFVFCPTEHLTLKDVLKKKFQNAEYIRIYWKLFVHKCKFQPKSVIERNTITHSNEYDPTSPMGIKCLARTRFLKSVRIHQCDFTKEVDAITLLSHNDDIQINHYRTQSDEFLYGVKEQRGGGVHKAKYKTAGKNPESSSSFKMEDTLLKNKRKKLIQYCLNRTQVRPRIYPDSSWSRLPYT